MLAVQKPPTMSLFAATTFRPSHSRHPSAPVVVRPTHTPGLLTLSKPQQHPRPQQQQQHQRTFRSSPREKINHRPNQPAHSQELKKSLPSPLMADQSAASPPAEKAKTMTVATAAPTDKSRGRQHLKPAKDRAGRR